MKVVFSTRFIKQLAKAEDSLADLIYMAVEKFQDRRNHKALKVHKLTGKLSRVYAFSATYRVRIIFYYPEKGVAELVMFGTHDETYR
jgi:mRNA-degrading endonuclease YafQ of YafQ-DinJ toxin-antitoxin module